MEGRRTLTARIHTSSSSEIQEFVNMDQWSDDQPCVCSSCSASLRPLTRQIPEWTRSSLAQQLQSQLKLLQFIWRPSVVIFILLLESPGYAWNAVQPDKWDEISAKIALFSGPALKRVRLRTDRSIWRWYQRKAICHNEAAEAVSVATGCTRCTEWLRMKHGWRFPRNYPPAPPIVWESAGQ